MLRRFLLTFALALIALLLQGTLLRLILPSLLVPNLILTIVVFLSFFDVTTFGAFLAFLVGLILDMGSGNHLLGPWAGASVVIFGVLASLSQRIFVESSFTAIVIVASSCFFGSIVFSIMVFQFQSDHHWQLVSVLMQSVVTGALAPLILPLIKTVYFGRGSRITGRSVSGRY